MAAPVLPLTMLGTGMYLAWFGVHYWRSDVKWPTQPVKDVLTGKGLTDPGAKPATEASYITAEVSSASATESTNASLTPAGPNSNLGTAANGAAIAADAEKYIGQGYTYGGPSSPGKWDCSSFVNYVVGHDLGMKIPGGSWAAVCQNGDAHGPATPSWMLFGTGVNYGSEQPGDIVVSVDHMGIVIGGGQMVSAQNPQLGTGIGNYTSGFPGGQPLVRRVT
jgi:peptidoglycan DL-endopeptidase CwlO